MALFGPLARRYRQEVSQRGARGLRFVKKEDFLDIIAIARRKAYTEENFAATWRVTGIEPFNIDAVTKRASEEASTTPSHATTDLRATTTPSLVRQVDDIIDTICSSN